MNESKIVKVLIGLTIILSFLILFSSGMSSAAQWAKTYGGYGVLSDDGAKSIQQTTDGGYIVAGYTDSFGAGYRDVWVLKLDSSGNIQLQKTYGGTSDDYAYSIKQTAEGGYIVAGYTDSFGSGSSDIWILKLDASGGIQWQKTYGGTGNDYAYFIQETTNGGYIVAGYTDSFSGGNKAAWVLKLDGSGNIQWQKTYGGTASGLVWSSIQQTTDGGYIVAGWTGSYTAYLWVLKLNSDGTVAWQKTYAGSTVDGAQSVQQTTDGGYIVAGWTNSDAWILKLDGSGNIQWQKKTDGGTNYGYDVVSAQQTTDGGYALAGITHSFSTGNDAAWVLKLDGSGNIQWQKTYGGTYRDYAYSIQQTNDGGYIVAGYTWPFGGHNYYDAWVLKLDANGEIHDCSSMGESNATVNNTNATINDTTVTVIDTNVSPQISTALIADTTAVVSALCIYPLYGCNLIPDATTIPRGGTLGLQATGSNNTGNTGSLLFATKVRLPNGNWYPSSGYLFGPFSFSLGPYQSKSKHLLRTIPSNAPLGTYTYYGYVGNYGVGIYDKCWFNFEVTQ